MISSWETSGLKSRHCWKRCIHGSLDSTAGWGVTSRNNWELSFGVMLKLCVGKGWDSELQVKPKGKLFTGECGWSHLLQSCLRRCQRSLLRETCWVLLTKMCCCLSYEAGTEHPSPVCCMNLGERNIRTWRKTYHLKCPSSAPTD